MFSKVSTISCLTLTGGEPSLVSKRIERIVDSASKHGVDIYNFYIATNGKRIGDTFKNAIKRLYYYCGENEISSVSFSNDKFHENLGSSKFHELEEWALYELGTDELIRLRENPIPGYSFGYRLDWNGVINEGRGNGKGGKYLEPDNILFLEDEEEGIAEGNIYLNVNGQVLNGCDFSYETQANDSRFRICHVEDFSLERVRKYLAKII